MAADVTLGLRRRREALGLGLGELARMTGVSKGYLSQLERGRASRPGAAVLLRLARVLGAEAVGLTVEDREAPEISEVLQAFAAEARLTASEIRMLAAIEYRGRRPQTAADYWFLWQAIQRTV